jgi:hypothetical protein
MLQIGQSGSRTRVSPWSAALCLFLAVLFVYNPFFTIYGSPSGLSFRHPLSVRGTLASSELRRSLVKDVKPKVDTPQEADLGNLEFFVASEIGSFIPEEESLVPKQEILSASLWFRPPPVL